jgi:hypothetical protein
MTNDERIEALTMNVELLSKDVESLRKTVVDLRDMTVSVAHSVERLVGLTDRLYDGVVNHEQRIQNIEARM